VFHNVTNNDALINNEHYIMKKAKYISYPHQQNCYDCSVFAIGTLLPPRYGILSTYILESLNSMYKDARNYSGCTVWVVF
jgi:hypothetical protein